MTESMEIITIDEIKRFIIRDFNKSIDEPKERLTPQKVFDFGLRIICMMRIDEHLADAIAESTLYVDDLMEKTLPKKMSIAESKVYVDDLKEKTPSKKVSE